LLTEQPGELRVNSTSAIMPALWCNIPQTIAHALVGASTSVVDSTSAVSLRAVRIAAMVPNPPKILLVRFDAANHQKPARDACQN
jgi:hypothetical protein